MFFNDYYFFGKAVKSLMEYKLRPYLHYSISLGF